MHNTTRDAACNDHKCIAKVNANRSNQSNQWLPGATNESWLRARSIDAMKAGEGFTALKKFPNELQRSAAAVVNVAAITTFTEANVEKIKGKVLRIEFIVAETDQAFRPTPHLFYRFNELCKAS